MFFRSTVSRLALSLLFISFFIFSCNNDDDSMQVGPVTISNLNVSENPSGYAPLTAKLSFTTSEAVRVKIRVIGKNGAASDIEHTFPDQATNFDLPILGLYPEYKNEVEITLIDDDNNPVGTQNVEIETEILSGDLPFSIVIDQEPSGAVKEGLTLVNYFGYESFALPQEPFMFDNFGDIRWYLDFSEHPQLSRLFYDNGIQELQNGNLLFGDRNSSTIYEINRLGEIQNNWPLPPAIGFHHTAIEKPNGNLLITVNDFTKFTEEDVILELDRVGGGVINRWDIDDVMDRDRAVWDSNRANLERDWFHANGITYSPTDDCIIVSGRTQGTVKLTADNEVVWILAPHKGWLTDPDGNDLNDFLLQPLDNAGNPINDDDVRMGNKAHPDFDWAWYQHSPVLLDNGNLMLFDNGENRHFGNSPLYSRAVEFKIDETNKTIQQIWAYGEERGEDTYSQVVSNVDFYPNLNQVLFAPGAVVFPFNNTYGKVIEVDRASKTVQFEATIRSTLTLAAITFHNVKRIKMYPD